MAMPSGLDEIFRKSLERFKIGLNTHEKEDFALTTLDDVHDTIDKIQRMHGSECKMQNMARLQGFLEGMEQYGTLIEVFLNVSVFVAFVWGPVKFLLQIAKTCVESLDALLNAYEQIGETIPLLAQYDKSFAGEPAMQRVLGLMYQDILEFHRRALVVFKRKSWQKVFRSAWKDFDKHFKRLLENLRRHRSDVESQASLVEVERNQASREAQDKQFAEMESAERKMQAISIIQKLSPANFNLDQESLARCWSKDPSFGGWLFGQEKIKAWLNPMNLETNVLWLKGIPGAGKSVVASRIIAVTKESKKESLLFFYCKHEDRSRSSLAAILKGLLAQIIYINNEILPFVYDECSKSSELTLDSVDFLKNLVESALDGPDTIWIVLDGLDECERKEKKKILMWVTSLVKSEEQPGRIRVLIISQDEGDIRKQLRKRPFISLNEAPQHKQAIYTYATRKAIKIRKKFGLSESKALEPSELRIITLVTEHAKGMFLFARLVLKHLKSQVSLTQLRKELDPSLFPIGLYEIYDRIIRRVYSHPLPQRQAAERILAWIVCARRQLLWNEIQAIFSIDLESETVDFEGRRLRGMDIKDLCGSLVEISSNKVIELVHHTARSYLVDDSRPNMQPRVNTSEMDFDIAITCLHYLSFPCFDPKLADEAISVLLFRGYYSFQDFATAYWSDYLCSCTSSKSLSPAQVERLASALDKLINRYFIHERQTGELLDENSMFRDLNRSRIIRQLQALRPTSNSSTVVPKSSAKYEITSLHGQLQRRRLIFESSINKLSSNDPHRFNLTIYYGDAEGWFKCPKEQCFAFYEGFTSAESRDQHHKKHLRPHLCSYSGCIYATLGFTNFNELKRHQSNAHPILLEEAAVEFPHSETPLTGHKNKMTKLSSDGQSLEESLDILMDSREEEFEFPAPDVAKSTLSGHEVVMPDATPLLDKPGTELPISYEPNINSPLFRPILDEHRGKPPTSSSRKFAPGTRGPPPLNTIKSLITDLRLFKFDHIGTYPPAGYTARMSAEEKWIAVSTSKTPRQADALDVDLRFTFQHESVVATVCFSPDGKFIATGGNKVARWFSTIDGSVLHSFVVRSTDSVKDNFCRSVCFNPNARLLVTAWEDKIIRILIVRTGFLTGQLKGHDQDIYDIDIGRDGCTMVSGSGDRTARVWDIWTHQEKMILSHKDGVVCVSISTDSARVATGGLDKAIWIWDLTTGNLLKKLLAHTDCIYCIRFTPDNQFLVSGSLDKTLLSWNVGPLGTDKPLTRFEGHNDFVISTAFSHDGKWMLSGSKDRCALFWDMETGTAHHIICGHDEWVVKVATSPVEDMFATAGGDMKMRLWKYSTAGKRSNLHDLLS